MIIKRTRLREDEGDFIEINGMKLPKDYVLNVLSKAQDVGLDSPETVIANRKKAEEERRADAERKAEEESKDLIQKGTELYNSFTDIYNDNNLSL